MKPTEILKEEHKLVLLMLKIMEAVCTRLSQGQAVSTEDLAAIIDFIRTFADGCHHAKEEKLLFVALEKAGMPQNDGPVAVMLSEHALGRGYVQGMDSALGMMKNGDPSAAGAFAKNARGYIELLVNHIDKEDRVLFVMADQRLSPEAQTELLEGFDRVEREETGAGVHEKYHALLHRLRDAYL
ncbi:MAG: hemerythrin domain-containing protein [Deltaproteobacteria bacterium]